MSCVQTLDNNAYHAYHQDEQGSTAYVTGQGRETENIYQYDAFGNLLEKREDVSNRILYTGQQYDQETGQYYLRARYYNPVVGRFLQEDTYRGDGLNLYAYCANNPVVYYDPSGHNCDGQDINDLPDTQAKQVKNDSNIGGIETPINSGTSKPKDKATPNSIYEQMNPDGTVKSRAFYDENGNQFNRQDFDHPHFDKKTQRDYQPHEHSYHYNEDGFRDGVWDGPLTPGYNNLPTQ